MKLLSNCLYIVSTPIGNLNDITFRAIEMLKNSDIILCEDTRHSSKLLNHFKIKKKLISYHKFNEKKQVLNIIEYINQGKILSLISDAGTPLLSDPGRILVNQCIKEKIVNKAKKYLKKYSLKDTVDLILDAEGINKKKEVYKLCLKIKNEKNY